MGCSSYKYFQECIPHQWPAVDHTLQCCSGCGFPVGKITHFVLLARGVWDAILIHILEGSNWRAAMAGAGDGLPAVEQHLDGQINILQNPVTALVQPLMRIRLNFTGKAALRMILIRSAIELNAP